MSFVIFDGDHKYVADNPPDATRVAVSFKQIAVVEGAIVIIGFTHLSNFAKKPSGEVAIVSSKYAGTPGSTVYKIPEIISPQAQSQLLSAKTPLTSDDVHFVDHCKIPDFVN